MKKKKYLWLFSIFFILLCISITISCKKDNDDCNCPATVTDIDGNIYNTVLIGNQCWLRENLRTTKYNDGTSIPNVTDSIAWINLTTGGYCYNNNTNNSNLINTYGCLYNGYAIKTGKLAPTGWHVPTDEEWTELTDYLGGISVAGGKLKESGTVHWNSPNTGATNESGFTALPGGCRDYNGIYAGIGGVGLWWSATEVSTQSPWPYVRIMGSNTINVVRQYYLKAYGLSVRCVKDK